MSEIPINNGEKLEEVERNEKGQVVSGVLNPNGRPKGSRNFNTLSDEAIEEYARANKLDIEEVRKRLYIKGIKGILDGDFSFYRDYMDRVHGKPTQPIDLSGDNEVWDKLAEIEKRIKNDEQK